jgi:hypothetical protein|tara:strand:- start:122 stop:760 length:639 start_codon:yes stop_codon:yes gene_type:complete
MGYLDNDTIVVDAILTKHGRKILSDGGAIAPSHFALSDDGIDYSLWNKSSTSGSSGYDDYITSMPMVEAVPDDLVMMRYKLLSLNQNTQNMPIVKLGNGLTQHTLSDTQETAIIDPYIDQYGGTESFIFKISDSTPINVINMGGGTVVDMSGSPVDYPSQQNIPTYIEIVGGNSLELSAVSGLTSNKTVHITIEGMNSGALKSVQITVVANA